MTTGAFNDPGGDGNPLGQRLANASGNLAKLAGMVGVFEHDTDANDNVVSKF